MVLINSYWVQIGYFTHVLNTTGVIYQLAIMANHSRKETVMQRFLKNLILLVIGLLLMIPGIKEAFEAKPDLKQVSFVIQNFHQDAVRIFQRQYGSSASEKPISAGIFKQGCSSGKGRFQYHGFQAEKYVFIRYLCGRNRDKIVSNHLFSLKGIPVPNDEVPFFSRSLIAMMTPSVPPMSYMASKYKKMALHKLLEQRYTQFFMEAFSLFGKKLNFTSAQLTKERRKAKLKESLKYLRDAILTFENYSNGTAKGNAIPQLHYRYYLALTQWLKAKLTTKLKTKANLQKFLTQKQRMSQTANKMGVKYTHKLLPLIGYGINHNKNEKDYTYIFYFIFVVGLVIFLMGFRDSHNACQAWNEVRKASLHEVTIAKERLERLISHLKSPEAMLTSEESEQLERSYRLLKKKDVEALETAIACLEKVKKNSSRRRSQQIQKESQTKKREEPKGLQEGPSAPTETTEQILNSIISMLQQSKDMRWVEEMNEQLFEAEKLSNGEHRKALKDLRHHMQANPPRK